MIKLSDRKPLFIQSVITAALVLLAAGYSLHNTSVYHPSTPESLLPGAVSQDMISVLSAIGLVLCLVLISNGKKMAWLIWAGLLGYLFYAYALYSFERVYNQLYLLYVAIAGLSVYSLIGFFVRADLAAVRPKTGSKPPPRRTAAILFLFLAMMFTALWLSQIIPAMGSRIPPGGNTIFVLDLSFFLPLLVIEALFLLRRKTIGDAIAIPILMKIATLGISVLLGTVIAVKFGQNIDPASVCIYSILGLGPLVFLLMFVKSLGVY